MGKLHKSVNHLLGLLCASAFAFPLVASAGTVSVEVSPTTGYTSTTSGTFAPPARSSVTAIQSYKPTLGPLSGGGAYQTMQSGITITGIKQESQTLSSTVSSRLRATAGAMRDGAVRCFTSFRCNLALSAGAAGVQTLLDGIDWILDEGGKLQMPDPDQPVPNLDQSCSAPACSGWSHWRSRPTRWPTPEAACRAFFGARFISVTYKTPTSYECRGWVGSVGGNQAVDGVEYFVGETISCPDGSRLVDNVCVADDRKYIPAPPAAISDAFSNYAPDPTDLPFVTGGLDFSHEGVDIEIVDIPSITGADSPNFIEYSDGTSKGTYSQYEFTWGGPSKQPEISVNERTTETTYSSTGEPTGTTTTTSSSSGSSANNEIEIPTDCDFMPTVCRFIYWFTEPDPELSQEPDLQSLRQDLDPDRSFTVGTSTASCPAPFQISLSMFPSVEVSLQPLCDLVDLLRPLFLAFSFYISARIVLRT